MVLFLVASLFRASLHFSTEFDFILILSRALIEEAESLRKVICRSVVFVSVSAVAADSIACSSACATEL